MGGLRGGGAKLHMRPIPPPGYKYYIGRHAHYTHTSVLYLLKTLNVYEAKGSLFVLRDGSKYIVSSFCLRVRTSHTYINTHVHTACCTSTTNGSSIRIENEIFRKFRKQPYTTHTCMTQKQN